MNRIIASFTRTEQQLIIFVLATLGVGCALLQWNESRQSTLSFNTADVRQEIPRMPDPVLPEGMNSAGLMDINMADSKLLETLPGIGPAMAGEIIRYRERVGPLHSMDDLDKVPGIGPAMMTKLAPMVTFGDQVKTSERPSGVSAAIPKTGVRTLANRPERQSESRGGFASLAPTPAPMPNGLAANPDIFRSPPRADAVNINTASAEELGRLTGVGPSLARRIVADRLHNGPFRQAGDLDRVKGIGPSILRKNADMIRVE